MASAGSGYWVASMSGVNTLVGATVFTPRADKLHIISLRKASLRKVESMAKRPNPELVDEDNPEWTAQEIARARPASEVLPRLFGAKAAKDMPKPRGRPPAEVVKDRITIRLSPDVTAAFRASGDGWQTRIDAALRDWLRTHSPG